MTIFKCEHIGKRIRIYICGKRIASIHINKTEYDCRYAKKLKSLKKKYGREKIRVGFLVSEEAKWQYQSVYEELEKNENFEPVVLVTKLAGDFPHYKSISSCKAFFDNLGLRSALVFDESTETYLPLNQFGVDIVFYQQPWAIDLCQHPEEVSHYALTCYVPYAFQAIYFAAHYMKSFHALLWKIFVQDDLLLEELQGFSSSPISNCIPVGYPKLDAYFTEKPAKGYNKKVVIYAPHHSFEKGSLELATFQKNGKDILALAQKYHEEIYWIFKPHPRFKHAVIQNNLMTVEEIDAYYDAWAELGEIYDSGNYFSLFMASSALITDCGSFLGEYIPSGKPLFHLWSETAPYNNTIKTLGTSFYRITDMATLEEEFERVVIEEDDYKKAIRTSISYSLFDPKEKSATKIVQAITKDFTGLSS